MKKRLEELIEQQKSLCKYCGKPFEDFGDRVATVDHIIPRSLVRVLPEFVRPGNLVAACQKCNQEKADRLPLKWDGRLGDWELANEGWIFRGSV